MLVCEGSQMLAPVIHISLLGRFHHHPKQGFRAAGPHQHTT
jgi:hypothetical protein